MLDAGRDALFSGRDFSDFSELAFPAGTLPFDDFFSNDFFSAVFSADTSDEASDLGISCTISLAGLSSRKAIKAACRTPA